MQKTNGQFTNGYDARGMRTHLSCDELNSIGTCVYSGDTDGLTYRQTFDFDRFGNIYRKAPSNAAAGQANPLPFTPIEEATGPGTGDLDKAANRFRTETTYDDAGNVVGDGRIVKSYENRTVVQVYPAGTSTIEETECYVRSSMLGGQVLTELNNTGGKIKTNVYAGNGVIAEQIAASSTVVWRHTDVVTGSFDSTGTFPPNDPEFKAEFEPLGAVLPETDPNPDPQTAPMPNRQRAGGDFSNPEYGCILDGVYNEGPGACTNAIQNKTGDPVRNSDPFGPVRGYWIDLPGPISTLPPDEPGEEPVTVVSTLTTYVAINLEDHTGFFEDKESLVRPTSQTSGPCALMAKRAKKVADESVSYAVRITPFDPHGPSSYHIALPYFDFNFNTLYIGHVVDGSVASIRYFGNGGGKNSSSAAEQGQQDFKAEFLDSDFERTSTAKGADQVHHFAAYFSAGINGAALSSYVHSASDTAAPLFGRGIFKGANTGDLDLANAAYNLGKRIRKQPNLLFRIGDLIKNEFCL